MKTKSLILKLVKASVRHVFLFSLVAIVLNVKALPNGFRVDACD